MALSLRDFREVLQTVIEDDLCENDTLEYMAGVLSEADVQGLSAGSEIDGLIGPFLLDAGLPDNELQKVAEKIAISIAERLKGSNLTTSVDSPNKKLDNNETIRRPFDATSFLNGAHEGFHDPYLGLQKVNVNFNAQLTISESLKLQSAIQKERQKQLKLMHEWERAKAPLPPPAKKHGTTQLEKITDIIVDSFTVSVAGRELLRDASLKIVIGRKYGLIGRNGIGKSTFIAALVRQEIQGISKNISIGCVEQEINPMDMEMAAIDAVLAVDSERINLLSEEARLLAKPQTKETGERLAFIYQRLEEIDSNGAEAGAASILAGLGFSVSMQKQKIKELSGGWAMRVALARALFATPDILCLDEPTNHLDLHAVAWLTDFLTNSAVTCIIVSHARGFLNEVCTDIIDFQDQKLKYYRGDYDTFERVKCENERVQQRQFDAQQAKRDHMKSFIDRFRYNKSKSSLVQSRIKFLEKLPMLESVANDPSLTFNFEAPEKVTTPVLQLSKAYYSYDGSSRWILEDVDMTVDLESRIAICGVNGSGKTTLLKLLVGQTEPTKGICRRAGRLRIGFFSQHHVEQLDLTLNAVQELISRNPEADLRDEDARAFLGRFGISGLLSLEPLYILSGGQKSRVAIALMAFKNPHILILDEPTNHLDLDAVQALISALNAFEGGVVVVSHDIHLISCVADEIIHVDPKTHTVQKYKKGDINAYRKDTLKKTI